MPILRIKKRSIKRSNDLLI